MGNEYPKIRTNNTTSSVSISASSLNNQQSVSTTNNRAFYFAEQAKKYRDEAKEYKEIAKFYSEQNSDVTFDYIENIENSLEEKISQKQDKGNYALKSEIPKNLSDLNVDLSIYANKDLSNITNYSKFITYPHYFTNFERFTNQEILLQLTQKYNSSVLSGIDNIKKEDYVINGSPTISEFGVLTSASSSNYIYKESLNLSGNSFEIRGEFGVSNGASGNIPLFDINGAGMFVTVGQTGCVLHLYNQSVYSSSKALPIGKYEYKIAFSNSTVSGVYYRSKNGTNWTSVQNVLTGINLANWVNSIISGTVLKLGYCSISNYSTLSVGYIDLNSFKIYVDNSVVYQSCLKIPYKKSNMEIKIVEENYRNRVQDLFEQYGFNPYYTISNTDFTLANCKPNDVIDYFEDGLGSGYELRANLVCKQWGIYTSGTFVAFQSNYNYQNTNYKVKIQLIGNWTSVETERKLNILWANPQINGFNVYNFNSSSYKRQYCVEGRVYLP